MCCLQADIVDEAIRRWGYVIAYVGVAEWFARNEDGPVPAPRVITPPVARVRDSASAHDSGAGRDSEVARDSGVDRGSEADRDFASGRGPAFGHDFASVRGVASVRDPGFVHGLASAHAFASGRGLASDHDSVAGLVAVHGGWRPLGSACQCPRHAIAALAPDYERQILWAQGPGSIVRQVGGHPRVTRSGGPGPSEDGPAAPGARGDHGVPLPGVAHAALDDLVTREAPGGFLLAQPAVPSLVHVAGGGSIGRRVRRTEMDIA